MAVDKRHSTDEPKNEHDVADSINRRAFGLTRVLTDMRHAGMTDAVLTSRFLASGQLGALMWELQQAGVEPVNWEQAGPQPTWPARPDEATPSTAAVAARMAGDGLPLREIIEVTGLDPYEISTAVRQDQEDTGRRLMDEGMTLLQEVIRDSDSYPGNPGSVD